MKTWNITSSLDGSQKSNAAYTTWHSQISNDGESKKFRSMG